MSEQVTSVIIKKLYPLVETALNKNDSKFRNNIAKFINDRHELLFAIAPYDRIYFNQTDIDNMYKSLGITEKEVTDIMKETYFWDKPYNPQCAKEPYVETLMMCIRYYLKHSKQKYAELTTIYLAFSGKFYASLHGMEFPVAPPSKYPTVMDFVVNNMLTDKYDLKREGTVFGAVKSICITWLGTYGNDIKGNLNDDEVGKKVQQLRDRERSFLYNIGKLYYEASKNKNYLNYETDNVSDEGLFRLTDNDAATAARVTENTMNYLTSNYVSMDICNKCKDSNVKATEVCDIMQSILQDSNNLPDVRRVVNIIISDFMRNYPGQSIKSIEFVSYTMKAKPNTKDKYILEMKNTILSWLDENSPQYRKRKSRKSTAISYYKSLLMYLTLVINRCAK